MQKGNDKPKSFERTNWNSNDVVINAPAKRAELRMPTTRKPTTLNADRMPNRNLVICHVEKVSKNYDMYFSNFNS